jgi:hypothetical protein
MMACSTARRGLSSGLSSRRLVSPSQSGSGSKPGGADRVEVQAGEEMHPPGLVLDEQVEGIWHPGVTVDEQAVAGEAR